MRETGTARGWVGGRRAGRRLSGAACLLTHSAQPRATDSAAFSERSGSLPKKSAMMRLMKGTREEQPTSCTSAIWSSVSPEEVSACSSGTLKRAASGAVMASKSSRSILPCTSLSSIKHSMARDASVLADRIFFRRSMATSTRTMAFLFLRMSMPGLFLNSSAK